MLVTGRNGSGKTNLLESLHVGTQGFSPRTRSDAQLVRHGADRALVALSGSRGAVATELEVTLGVREAKQARLNGAALRSTEHLRGEVSTLVFTPDRLVVVKGGPAARRAYFDRVLGRLFPARAPLPLEYGAAVGQRNAALRRVAGGTSSRDAIAPWTLQVAELGRVLTAARLETVELLAALFAERASELGLPAAALAYDPEPPTVAALEQRLDRDLERGTTGLGPHLDDVALRSSDRDLSTYGSQGEQRLVVLSLLLAEAELLTQRRGLPPLLLLDDVLSELDAGRRRILSDRIGARGPDRRHRHRGGGAAARAGPAADGHARSRSVSADGTARPHGPACAEGSGRPRRGTARGDHPCLAGDGRGRDRPGGLAAAADARRDAARQHDLVGVGLRARAHGTGDPREARGGAACSRAHRPPLPAGPRAGASCAACRRAWPDTSVDRRPTTSAWGRSSPPRSPTTSCARSIARAAAASLARARDDRRF